MVVIGVFALVEAVAAAHSVDVDRWRAGFDEVSDRIASRFARCEPLRNAGAALMLDLISDLARKNCWTLAERSGHASRTGCSTCWAADPCCTASSAPSSWRGLRSSGPVRSIAHDEPWAFEGDQHPERTVGKRLDRADQGHV